MLHGRDARGRWHCGVLEQSWRIGGASGAELAGLQALRDDPAREWVDASTHEVYASHVEVPAQAQVHFDGIDPRVGRVVKYAMVEAHDGA